MELGFYLDLIRARGVVACPTETQMGLLADGLDERVLAHVSAMKQRPASEPISLLVPSLEYALSLVNEISALAIELANAHWPGPLTLIMHGRPGLPAALLKDGRIAMRVPGQSIALELVKTFGGALTATSANLSGQPPLATEAELRATFGAALSGIVPAAAPGGQPSTIVDVTGEQPIVVRQGALVV